MSSRPIASDARRSRQVAAGLLALVVVIAILVLAGPAWYLYTRYDSELAERRQKLARYSQIVATRPEVARQLEAMRAKDARRFFLRSGASALSVAEAQEAIRTVVESSGGRLITMQQLPAKEEGRYRQVSAQVQLAANIRALRRILHTIEGNVPLLFVENLTVKTQVPSNFKPAAGAEPEMFVSFELHGYSLSGNP
jgi:general secretion pathway protein M